MRLACPRGPCGGSRSTPALDELTIERASKLAGERAQTAARCAIACGADPFVVIDHAIAQVTRFRERMGESPEHVATDPLIATVRDARAGRIERHHLMVMIEFALLAENEGACMSRYEDVHERASTWPLYIAFDLLRFTAYLHEDAETRASALGDLARMVAEFLVSWAGQIADAKNDGKRGLFALPGVVVEIQAAADEFIAELGREIEVAASAFVAELGVQTSLSVEADDEIDRADGVASKVEERAEAAMRDLFITTQEETAAARAREARDRGRNVSTTRCARFVWTMSAGGAAAPCNSHLFDVHGEVSSRQRRSSGKPALRLTRSAT